MLHHLRELILSSQCNAATVHYLGFFCLTIWPNMNSLFGLLFRPNRIQIEYLVQPYCFVICQNSSIWSDNVVAIAGIRSTGWYHGSLAVSSFIHFKFATSISNSTEMYFSEVLVVDQFKIMTTADVICLWPFKGLSFNKSEFSFKQFWFFLFSLPPSSSLNITHS